MLDILYLVQSPSAKGEHGVTKGCCLRERFQACGKGYTFCFHLQDQGTRIGTNLARATEHTAPLEEAGMHQGPNLLMKASCSLSGLGEHNVFSLLLLSFCSCFDPLPYTAHENSQWDLIFWNLKINFPNEIILWFSANGVSF